MNEQRSYLNVDTAFIKQSNENVFSFVKRKKWAEARRFPTKPQLMLSGFHESLKRHSTINGHVCGAANRSILSRIFFHNETIYRKWTFIHWNFIFSRDKVKEVSHRKYNICWCLFWVNTFYDIIIKGVIISQNNAQFPLCSKNNQKWNNQTLSLFQI